MFRAASDDDIEVYSDTVTCFIRKCIEDVVQTKTIRIYPNQKPWINSDVRSALSARTSAFKSGNTDDRKQASYDLRRAKAGKRQYKNKVEEHFNNNNPRSMWQGINNITGFKGSAPTYFHSLLRIYIPSRSLRSASERRLVVPSQRGSKSLSRTFSFTIPGWWNDLHTPIRNAGSLSIFKQQLKTHFLKIFIFLFIFLSFPC